MQLNDIFSSGMVFAAGRPVRIYGTGEGSATITFAGVTRKVTAQSGQWYTEFPAMEYGGPYELVLTTDNQQIVFDDIYVGDVYLFAGQSNMEFTIKGGKDDLALCESNDMLRLFSPHCVDMNNFLNPSLGWVKAEIDTAPEWPSIAHFAGIQLAKEKGIAIGIIACSQGASVIESWVPKDIFRQNGIIVPLEEKTEDHRLEPYSTWNENGLLYAYMLRQVIPFALTGVVWYQGESDTSVAEAKVYGQELAILVDSWRKDFQNPELPFVVIQIADFDKEAGNPGWRMVQQAQYDIQFNVPNVKTVISADVCCSDDIHPPQKYALSQRLAKVLLEE